MKFETKVELLRTKKYEGRETQEFLEDVAKMAKGESLEYLLGEVLFCEAIVDLSLRPMIPRPETEHWVREVLNNRQQITDNQTLSKNPQVLDLFAGSGCVGLAVLKNIPESHVTFVEIDKNRKEQISISLAKNKIKEGRASIVIQDCIPFLATGPRQKWDAIFAVPPYVPRAIYDEVMKELHTEDPLFFFDKEDGFYFHKQVLAHAKDLLAPSGQLHLEFDITQRERIEQLALLNGFTNYSFLKDPYGHECVIMITN